MKILALQGNLYASGYYRIAHPLDELKLQGLAEVEIVTKNDGWRNSDETQFGWLLSKMLWADIVVYELQTNPIAAKTIPVIKKYGKKVVIDYDDDLFHVPDWNPAYFNLGTRYVDYWTGKNGKKMNVEHNKENIASMIASCKEADMVTVTGKKISEVYGLYNDCVRIIPNSVDFRLIKPCKKSTDGKVRIFWQGSTTHAKDLHEIKDVFIDITKKYPNVQWVIWGSAYKDLYEVFGLIPEDRIEFIETVPFERYYQKLNSLTIDIGICPLVDIHYNECKSNIKWLEYSALKLPAVVSKISTYGAVDHGITGYKARKYHEWMKSLSRLIESPDLRAEIAEKAYTSVKEKFNIEKNAHLWADTYKELCP